VNKAIKVFIERKFPKNKNSEKELFYCIKQIRRIAPQQPGYISGEYLKSIDEKDEIATISTWFSLDDWQAWFESKDRKEIQLQVSGTIPSISKVKLQLSEVQLR
jgi:heme-degrading monooxygenase HmoA